MEDYPRTLKEFDVRFRSEEACREYLLQLRWPDGFRCPRCGCRESSPVRTVLLRCRDCRHQTSVTAGTICYIGGLEEDLPGRLNLDKALIVVAAQEDGPGIGRIRMRQIVDASGASLVPFVQDSVEPGSVIHTDGWLGYLPLESKGYKHEVTFLKGKKKTPSELMPRVHLAISLLKRWLMGTHQGAVSHKHLNYYLDEFTFRFNRRRSKSRGKLFFRLAQQAVAIDPVSYGLIVHSTSKTRKRRPQHIGAT